MSYCKSKPPKFQELMNPILCTLRVLEGQGTLKQIYTKLIELYSFDKEILNIQHVNRQNLSEIEYRISWALSYLKEFNFVDNPKRGTWKLTKEAWKKKLVDPKEVISVFRYKYNIKHYGKLRIITESLKNKFKNMCNFLITL